MIGVLKSPKKHKVRKVCLLMVHEFTGKDGRERIIYWNTDMNQSPKIQHR